MADRADRQALAPCAATRLARLRARGQEAVQFDGPLLELMTGLRSRIDHSIARLGPDILGAEFDEADFLRRLREDDPTRPIGDALLDQSIVAGLGNIWRAEACFGCRHQPVAPKPRR